ncbi:anti-sigma regulatory factor [Xylanibacillus composti]|uniref:Serine/threonine-protein kinase RsbT n=1 Tax=Xylanibacillus composti TaxID=1572762 RepID=A0A8J4M3K5_9BACL|nr:anti-sigma regulatory factor [Xylanibacillus composti]MDT9724654.1 anti-sigma regulatory factor [Xylanibacillus composti]GIQ70939.1 serine/threonine-protein kinase RsbT [Xylanibacillus composti]
MVEKIQILQEQDAIVARQRGRDLAKQLGFSLVDQTRIAISISELARNMLIYAGAGEIEIRQIEANDDLTGIEIRAEDKGPGITDLEMAMTDGYTSSGGLGMGLPGTKRLMDDFEIRSEVGKGTSVTIRKWLST